jgi:tetratricopeptide (TPR) repeat protein
MKTVLLIFIFLCVSKIGFAQSANEFYNRGNYFIKQGQMDSAMTSFNQSLEMDSTYYKSYHGRATVYLATKKYAEAIKDYTTCIRLKFNYSEAFYGRGIAYMATGKSEKACLDFQEAMNFGLKEGKEMMEQYCR